LGDEVSSYRRLIRVKIEETHFNFYLLLPYH
jgi:hypothetical protein